VAGIKVLILEDELIVAEELKEILSGNGYEVIGTANSGEKALRLAQRNLPDVALLDINVKGDLDGIEVAEKLLDQNDVAIIFLTAYSDQAIVERAKQIKPAAYIVKPFNEKNLNIAIDLAFTNINSLNSSNESHNYLINDRIFIKENNRFHKVRLEDVILVEAVGSYSKVHTLEKNYTLSFNLKALETRLQSSEFFRIHRSFLVNIKRITAFEGNRVFINELEIPVGTGYRKEFLSRFKFL
jgi:DNA-binding LytR/AlgR family response regulator